MTTPAPIAQGLLQALLHETVLVVPVEPHVKSVKTRELFNAGVNENAKIRKSVDPSCYVGDAVELTTVHIEEEPT